MRKRLIATLGRTFQSVQSVVYSFAVERVTFAQLMAFILAGGLNAPSHVIFDLENIRDCLGAAGRSHSAAGGEWEDLSVRVGLRRP